MRDKIIKTPKGGIIIIQPAIPKYRLDYFDKLSELFGERLSVYTSNVNLGALTAQRPRRFWEKYTGPIAKILPGLEWQAGVLQIKVSRGDVVVISGAPRCLTNILFLLKARFLGARTVWWGHYWSSTSKRWRFVLRLILMRLSNYLLFYTDKEVEEYFAHKGNRHQPAFALNNGISIEEIQKERIVYSASKRGKRLLFIGRLTFKSGLDILLHALAAMKKNEVYLDVIGDGECGADLKDLAQKLGIEDFITWHDAITDEKKIANIANHCSLFVYPGGVGLSLIHAMAYGLPAIVHSDRYKHMPEIAAFKEGKTGLSFHFNDAENLSVIINDALRDFDRMEKWSSESIKIVERSFNTKIMAERFFDMINKIEAQF